MAFFSSCTPGGMSNGGKTPVDYQDPLHPQYMATPTVLNFPDTARVFLEDEDYAQFQDDLLGFLESNNENDFARHFGDYYIPETFENDSIFDMYVTMWGRWDSIGVSTRLDHWTLLYASPFYEGDVYDVSLAEIDLRHHVVFQKRWTGNYKNFGRTLGERYPGASISYMDTTYVDAAGDTVLRRHITASNPAAPLRHARPRKGGCFRLHHVAQRRLANGAGRCAGHGLCGCCGCASTPRTCMGHCRNSLPSVADK